MCISQMPISLDYTLPLTNEKCWNNPWSVHHFAHVVKDAAGNGIHITEWGTVAVFLLCGIHRNQLPVQPTNISTKPWRSIKPFGIHFQHCTCVEMKDEKYQCTFTLCKLAAGKMLSQNSAIELLFSGEMFFTDVFCYL